MPLKNAIVLIPEDTRSPVKPNDPAGALNPADVVIIPVVLIVAACNCVMVLRPEFTIPFRLPVTSPITAPVCVPAESPVKLPPTLPVTLPVTLPCKLPSNIGADAMPVTFRYSR